MSESWKSRSPELAHMTWCGVQEAIAQKAVAFIPVGSTEAHGPHLPLSTDVVISTEMAKRAAQKLAEMDIRSVIAPPISYSITEFSKDFPGTISIRSETAAALIRDIGMSLGRQGFKTLCIANSHLEPDHINMLREVAELVSRRTGAVVCFPDKTRRRWAETLTDEFQSGSCHAGQYESSLVLAADPNLVDDKRRKELKPNEISLAEKIKAGAKTFRQAGGDEAYFGDPAAATPEEGNQSYEALSDMLVMVIKEALSDSAGKTVINGNGKTS